VATSVECELNRQTNRRTLSSDMSEVWPWPVSRQPCMERVSLCGGWFVTDRTGLSIRYRSVTSTNWPRVPRTRTNQSGMVMDDDVTF